MAHNEKFNYESIQDSDTIRDYIQSIITGIENGKIVLSQNGDEVVLNPGNLLKFEIKAKKKGDTNKLSIKISWREEGKTLSIDEDSDMTIT